MAAVPVAVEVEEEEAEPVRARIWLFSFLASAASCSFCSWAAVLGGGAVVMEVLATLLRGWQRGRLGSDEVQTCLQGGDATHTQRASPPLSKHGAGGAGRLRAHRRCRVLTGP